MNKEQKPEAHRLAEKLSNAYEFADDIDHNDLKLAAMELESLHTRVQELETLAAPLNVWQQAIDAELVNAYLGVAHNNETFEGARKALHELICWHVGVATNPATNGGQRLTDAKPIVWPVAMPDPVAAQVRFKPENDTAWSRWKVCAVEDAREIEAYTLANGWGYEVRYLYPEQQVSALLATGGQAHVWEAPVRELLSHIDDVLPDGVLDKIDTKKWGAVSRLVGIAANCLPQADATTPQGLRECCEHLNAAWHTIPSTCPHIIWYDDRDRAPEIFAGEGAKEAAERRFEQISDSWNAHLFVSIAANSRDCPHPVATVADPHPEPQADAWDEESEKLLRALYDRGYEDRAKERDYDPLGASEFDAAMCAGAARAKQADALDAERWVSESVTKPLESDGEVFVRFSDGTFGTGWASYWHGASDDFAQWSHPDPEEDRTVTHWMKPPAIDAAIAAAKEDNEH